MNVDAKRKKRVALYIRVSTDDQVEMFGVDLQKNSLMAHIESKSQDLEFAGDEYVYIDEGISGSMDYQERPQFQALMEDATGLGDKPFDIVAVYKIDRFARRLRILLEIFDYFNKTEIEFISVNESIDTSTPFGRAMLGIMGVIAELEMENIRERTSKGRLASAEKGHYHGPPPVGYVKDENGRIVINEVEEKVVKDIFSMFVNEGLNTTAIANYLAEHKVPSPQTFRYKHKKEKPGRTRSKSLYVWDTTAIRNILKNELYIGNQYFNKTKLGKDIPKDKWGLFHHNQVLIDRKLFDRTQKMLVSRKRTHSKKAKNQRTYLLQGLVKCGNCYDPLKDQSPYGWNGTTQTVRSTGKKKYYYLCSNKHSHKSKVRGVKCSSLPLSALPLEEHVVNLLYKLIKNPKVVFRYQQRLQSNKAKMKAIKNRHETLIELLNAYEPSKNRITEMYRDGDLTKKEKDKEILELKAKNKKFSREKRELDGQLSIYSSEKEYIKVFKIFEEAYEGSLDRIKGEQDLQKISKLVHMIVEDIVVLSRPRRKTDKVSGPKKEGQVIPYRLKISLKVPNEMLGDLLSSIADDPKFDAKMDEWWAIQDLNL